MGLLGGLSGVDSTPSNTVLEKLSLLYGHSTSMDPFLFLLLFLEAEFLIIENLPLTAFMPGRGLSF